jgi:SAM-dependent methyltransferase
LNVNPLDLRAVELDDGVAVVETDTYGTYGTYGTYAEPELVDMLADLAGEGPALELGIGGGRVAFLLAERGVPVVGVDVSAEMVAKLQERRGDLPITVSISDMAAPAVDGPSPWSSSRCRHSSCS